MTYGLTDIHQHLLWGLDDGAKTPEIMQGMLREAHRQGIVQIAATCHVCPGMEPFDIGLYRERLAEANAFCKQEDLDVTVFSGAEVAWTYQTESALRRGSVPTLGSTDYVLLELWRDISLQEAKHAVRSLIRAGYCPVLAHVERYRCFTWFPQQAMRLREETGAWFQVNASTLLKPQGMLEKRLIRRLLSDGGLDVVASDAHGNAARPLNLRQAHAWLVQHTDADYARALTTFHGELE